MAVRGTKRRPGRPKGPGLTKARILDCAEAVFAEKGFTGTRTQDIARRARVSVASLHFYWKAKKRLYTAVYQRLFTQRAAHAAQLLGLIQEAVAAQTPREELLQAVVSHLLAFFRQHPHAARLYANQVLEARTVGVTLQPAQLGALLTTLTTFVRPFLVPDVARTTDVDLTFLSLMLLVIGTYIQPQLLAEILGEADATALEARLRRHLHQTLDRLIARPPVPRP
jgi:AcrR family transcriptional regulator